MQKNSDKRYLFVCGCPRSGTTALNHVMNWFPEVYIGIERFAALFARAPQNFTPELFVKERFAEFRKGDCGYSSFDNLEYSVHYARRFEIDLIDEASVVGDKITKLYKSFDVFTSPTWAEQDVTVVQIIRNIDSVASSYERRKEDPKDKWSDGRLEALKDWNESMSYTANLIAQENTNIKLVVVSYEGLFENGVKNFLAGCRLISTAVGLNHDSSVEAGLKKVFANGMVRANRRIQNVSPDADEEWFALVKAQANDADYRTLMANAIV